MSLNLNQILTLVGKLDDAPGEDTPRERFRHFLREDVLAVGDVRDHIDTCLRQSGDQYSRALQDLVNYIGHFLGFKVVFGRYQGTPGQAGFDGHWISPAGFHIVIEVKTSEVYAIKTATLIGYVDQLISERQIPDWDHALGMYVVGRPDPEIRQLENAILAERRTNQLRIVSAEALLSLAELMAQYDVSHEDILAILRPSGPTIDPIANLLSRVVAQGQVDVETGQPQQPAEQSTTAEPPRTAEPVFWLTPVRSDEVATAEETIETLVKREHVYAFGDKTPGRKHIKPGDWICFYATGKGVVGHAQVKSHPERKPHPKTRHPDLYPWTFGLGNIHLYLDDPVVIDADCRSQLNAFVGHDVTGSWAWFVQATRKVTEHDFRLITRGDGGA